MQRCQEQEALDWNEVVCYAMTHDMTNKSFPYLRQDDERQEKKSRKSTGSKATRKEDKKKKKKRKDDSCLHQPSGECTN